MGNVKYYETHRAIVIARNKEWIKANPDKVRVYQQNYRAKNKEKIKRYAQAYNLKNKEKRRARWMAYFETNREKIAEKNRVYRATHPERVKESQRRCFAADPERARTAKRNSAYRRAYGITVETYDELLAAQGGVCALCGAPSGARRFAVDHDHVTKKVRGLLHRQCNLRLGQLEKLPFPVLKALAYIAKHKRTPNG